jgi:hypothetical protein
MASVVILGIMWIQVKKLIENYLYAYLQMVQSLITPALAALFFLGVFSREKPQVFKKVLIGAGIIFLFSLYLFMNDNIRPWMFVIFLLDAYTDICLNIQTVTATDGNI